MWTKKKPLGHGLCFHVCGCWRKRQGYSHAKLGISKFFFIVLFHSLFLFHGYLIINFHRIRLKIQIIVKDSRNLYLVGNNVYHLVQWLCDLHRSIAGF